jgi:hypothetical protein
MHGEMVEKSPGAHEANSTGDHPVRPKTHPEKVGQRPIEQWVLTEILKDS